MNKLSREYQLQWEGLNQLYNRDILSHISDNVNLHKEIENVRSSAAACLNILGELERDKDELKKFLNCFDLDIQEIIDFPAGINVEGEIYDDIGPIIFEWIGPKRSPILEKGGCRGSFKTSIDAYIIVKINNKITQLLIEWKFTESYVSGPYLHRFSGTRGIERLRRYTTILASLRNTELFPFNMTKQDSFGIYDLGYEPFYQLLRMTLLAKKTIPLKLGNINIEDYRIIHLSHSQNKDLNILSEKHTIYTPGIKDYINNEIHEIWRDNILSDYEKEKFKYGYWDEVLRILKDGNLKDYLIERYG